MSSDPLGPARGWDTLKLHIRRYLGAYAYVLFPPRCAGCGTFGTLFCSSCRARVQPLRPPLCSRCGQPLTAGSLCRACKRGKFVHLDMARAATLYAPPMRAAIHHFKYRRNIHLAPVLARFMLARVRRDVLDDAMLLPVPLHPEREKMRGFNQAALLARHLGTVLRLPLAEGVLERSRPTRPQVTLSLPERMENMRGAFRVLAPERVRGRAFLLIDDVMTTGSTLEACAQALKDAGARRVWAYVLSRAAL